MQLAPTVRSSPGGTGPRVHRQSSANATSTGQAFQQRGAAGELVPEDGGSARGNRTAEFSVAAHTPLSSWQPRAPSRTTQTTGLLLGIWSVGRPLEQPHSRQVGCLWHRRYMADHGSTTCRSVIGAGSSHRLGSELVTFRGLPITQGRRRCTWSRQPGVMQGVRYESSAASLPGRRQATYLSKRYGVVHSSFRTRISAMRRSPSWTTTVHPAR